MHDRRFRADIYRINSIPRGDNYGRTRATDESKPTCKGSHILIYSFDASQFNNWSDTAEAEHDFPKLIRQLVLATLPEPPSRIDIPSGSSVRLPGWDGILEVGHGNAWAPSGVSGWEFSCDKRSKRKASEDYEKRTADPLEINRATTTFVFATPRRWKDKRQWVKKRREEGKWRDVRAYDADDLAMWLEQAPEVAQWFAKAIIRLPFDFQAIDRIEGLSQNTNDQITAGFAEVAAMRVELQTLANSVATQRNSLTRNPYRIQNNGNGQRG